MNKVLFICLVSLSICFSSPTGKEEKPIQEIAAVGAAPAAPVELKPQLPITEPTKAPEHAATIPSNSTAAVVTPTTNPALPPAPAHNETSTAKNVTAAPIIDNKTDNKTAKTEKPVPATEKPSSAATPTKPDDKKKNETTSEKPATTVKPTPTPESDDKHDVVLQSRAFDGPSFIGGIILTLGMLAVGFIGFRYYRSQTERNYHTL